jgi:hypothetical protein
MPATAVGHTRGDRLLEPRGQFSRGGDKSLSLDTGRRIGRRPEGRQVALLVASVLLGLGIASDLIAELFTPGALENRRRVRSTATTVYFSSRFQRC